MNPKNDTLPASRSSLGLREACEQRAARDHLQHADQERFVTKEDFPLFLVSLSSELTSKLFVLELKTPRIIFAHYQPFS